MPYDFVIDHDHQWLTIVATDPVSLDVAREILRQATEGAWTYRMLVDLRLLTWSPTTNEVGAILDETQRLTTTHGRRGPVALVATRSVLYGMARMYGLLGEFVGAQPVSVHGDIEAAERWLRAQPANTV